MHSAKIEELLRNAVMALGYELWGSEMLSQEGSKLLRVYIDSAKGVTLDDCERASRQIGALLDVEDPLPGRYRLEVSSPGLERPLFTLVHFERFVGCQVKIRLRKAIQGQRNFTGLLEGVDEDSICIIVSDEAYRLPVADIERANLRLMT